MTMPSDTEMAAFVEAVKARAADFRAGIPTEAAGNVSSIGHADEHIALAFEEFVDALAALFKMGV
jgi:hypothetical protein